MRRLPPAKTCWVVIFCGRRNVHWWLMADWRQRSGFLLLATHDFRSMRCGFGFETLGRLHGRYFAFAMSNVRLGTGPFEVDFGLLAAQHLLWLAQILLGLRSMQLVATVRAIDAKRWRFSAAGYRATAMQDISILCGSQARFIAHIWQNFDQLMVWITVVAIINVIHPWAIW